MTSADWNTWFRRIRIGLWTDTDYYRIPPPRPWPPPPGAIAWLPFHGFHHFIAGETGYGKSNTQRVIMKELWPGIARGAVEVIGFDAQMGVELQPVQDAGLLKEFYWGKEAGQKTEEFKDGVPYEATFAEALERHVEIMRQRTVEMKRMGVNEWHITPDKPARVILIDEAGQLFRESVAPKVKKRIIGAIDTLTYQSRKCGYVVVACTQHSNLNQIPIRHGLTFGVAHRMKTRIGYEQVTGNGLDMPPLPRGKAGVGLAYMSGAGKRVLKTQGVPRLERYREPVQVVQERMPAFVDVPAIGSVDTVTGEVFDTDDRYEQYKRDMMASWESYR